MKRRATSIAGAQYPTEAKPGRHPIRNVAAPTMMIVACSVGLRPNRSPICPKTMPPSGRATKPTAYVTNAAMIPSSGEPDDGKKNVPNTRLAAVA